jgi:hypothetical protein
MAIVIPPYSRIFKKWLVARYIHHGFWLERGGYCFEPLLGILAQQFVNLVALVGIPPHQRFVDQARQQRA